MSCKGVLRVYLIIFNHGYVFVQISLLKIEDPSDVDSIEDSYIPFVTR